MLSKKGDGFSNILMVMMMFLMVMVMRRWLTAMSHSSPNIHMLSKEGCQCTVTQHLVFPSDSLTECPLSTVASWHCVIMWHPPAQCSNVTFCDTVMLSWVTVQSHSPPTQTVLSPMWELLPKNPSLASTSTNQMIISDKFRFDASTEIFSVSSYCLPIEISACNVDAI